MRPPSLADSLLSQKPDKSDNGCLGKFTLISSDNGSTSQVAQRTANHDLKLVLCQDTAGTSSFMMSQEPK
jgi:hypothetical protein